MQPLDNIISTALDLNLLKSADTLPELGMLARHVSHIKIKLTENVFD